MSSRLESKSFSAAVVNGLAEIISGGSASDRPQLLPGKYRTLNDIREFFADCGFPVWDYEEGSRVYFTRDAIRGWSTARDDLTVHKGLVEAVADPREYLGQAELHAKVLGALNDLYRPDGFRVIVRAKGAAFVGEYEGVSGISSLVALSKKVDLDSLGEDIDRAMSNVDDDPEDALTAACAMVESACCSIIVECGAEFPKKRTIQNLFKAVQDLLDLHPAKDGVKDEIRDDVRVILTGLTAAVQGIGALRTHGGDAHGRQHSGEQARQVKRVDARIARLSVAASGAVCHFLIETWLRKFGSVLPRAKTED